jgi:predicted GIY-YIG superfamily endonuclease
MLLRDRLRARLSEMGDVPDYQRLASDVLGIRNAPPDLARRLVAQALVVEDRAKVWGRTGERICAAAPVAAAVYVLRDEHGTALYVGKAVNLRRRLRAHFARTRWPALKAAMARTVAAEWQVVGSEIEALVREAVLIHKLSPVVNVQIGPPDLETRAIPASLLRDVIAIVPSVEADSAELLAARIDGAWMLQRTRRNGADVAVHAARLRRFFRSSTQRRERRQEPAVAPIVFSWLAGRGVDASRLDPHDAPTPRELAVRLSALLRDERLFNERLDQRVINSKFRSTSARP